MNKAVELVAIAIEYRMIEVQKLPHSLKTGDAYYNEIAKSAIGALRNLPTETFESSEQMLHFIRVIDNIGLAIATGK